VLALVVHSLKPGGRFALLVPDTLFSADKQRTRQWLLERTTLEKVYSLGPDWFTTDVRMGTVLVQGRRSSPDPSNKITTIVLAGKERVTAQAGGKPLQQVEAGLSQQTAQRLCAMSEGSHFQVLASEQELGLLHRIESSSVHLEEISEHTRGDEINSDGLIWRCGNCGTYTVPGEKKQGGGYKDKLCHCCDAQLTIRDIYPVSLIAETQHTAYQTPYIDGGLLTRRYQAPPRRFLRKDLSPMVPRLKDDHHFKGPKILIRQAGVGVTATLVNDDCRCPQSVYIYRVNETARAAGYSERFILGCLVSRTMNYVLMKRFGEIDPARAFAKLTHARIMALPIPRIADDGDRQIVHGIEADVTTMLATASYGSVEDHRIDTRLRNLWKVTPDEGRHMNGFFSTLPDGQAVRDLFPDGAPPPVRLR